MRSLSSRFLAGVRAAVLLLLVTGHASAQEPTPPAPEPPRPTMTVFNLANARAPYMAEVLGEVISNARIAVDERTNRLILLGDDTAIRTAQTLLKELDVAAPQLPQDKPNTTPSKSVTVRLLWLASGGEGAAGIIPDDLAPVINELSKAGIGDLKLVANTMLAARGESFNLTSTPSLATPVLLSLDGTLKWKADDGTPILGIQLEVRRLLELRKTGEQSSPQLLINLSSTIDAPFGQFIVLGAAPIGKMESVFVLQVTPK